MGSSRDGIVGPTERLPLLPRDLPGVAPPHQAVDTGSPHPGEPNVVPRPSDSSSWHGTDLLPRFLSGAGSFGPPHRWVRRVRAVVLAAVALTAIILAATTTTTAAADELSRMGGTSVGGSARRGWFSASRTVDDRREDAETPPPPPLGSRRAAGGRAGEARVPFGSARLGESIGEERPREKEPPSRMGSTPGMMRAPRTGVDGTLEDDDDDDDASRWPPYGSEADARPWDRWRAARRGDRREPETPRWDRRAPLPTLLRREDADADDDDAERGLVAWLRRRLERFGLGERPAAASPFAAPRASVVSLRPARSSVFAREEEEDTARRADPASLGESESAVGPIPSVYAVDGDVFGNDAQGQRPATAAPRGGWAETPLHAVVLPDGATESIARLTLRDGDWLFATEALPWARLVVNGAEVAAPAKVRPGDLLALRVRCDPRVSAEGGGGRGARSATVRYGTPERSGTLRCSSAFHGAVPSPSEEEPPGRARRPTMDDGLAAAALGGGAKSALAAPLGGSSQNTANDTALGTETVFLVAPEPDQWMLAPPLEHPPVVVEGLGPGVTAPVTVRLGGTYATDLGPPEVPDGVRNGVELKVNGTVVTTSGAPLGKVPVWTRRGPPLTVPRPVTKLGGDPAEVVVRDGDRLRLRVRSPSTPGDDAHVVVFIGGVPVGDVIVHTASTPAEAAAAAALMNASTPAAAMNVGDVTPVDPPITSDHMARRDGDVVIGAMRAVPANATVRLPTAGFLTVSGVLRHDEFPLNVHAFERADEAGAMAARAAEEAATAKMEAAAADRPDVDAWLHAWLSALGEGDDVALPDWVEVRVEGEAVTPPTSVWLGRRVEVFVKAPPAHGVARHVVVRAGEQTWAATVLAEDGASIPAEAAAHALREAVDADVAAMIARARLHAEAAAAAAAASMPSLEGLDPSALQEALAKMHETFQDAVDGSMHETFQEAVDGSMHGTFQDAGDGSPLNVTAHPGTQTLFFDVAAHPDEVVIFPRNPSRSPSGMDDGDGGNVELLFPGGAGVHEGELPPLEGLGSNRSCDITVVASEESAAMHPSSGNLGDAPNWAELLVNGTRVDALPFRARDGDHIGLAVVSSPTPGTNRIVTLACTLASAPSDTTGFVGHDDVGQFVLFNATAVVRTVSALDPTVTSPSHFQEVTAMIDALNISSPDVSSTALVDSLRESSAIDDALRAVANESSRVPTCTPAEERLRRAAGPAGLVSDRASVYAYDEDDAAQTNPNLCGTRPACAPETAPSEGTRDVVFIVDASAAMGSAVFYDHVLDLLKTMFCASFEETQSQASVILYPAPPGLVPEACGAYYVAVPLARYTTAEWFARLDALRADPTACCDGSGAAGAAPLAEALDGAGQELAARGVGPLDRSLVVIVNAGVPSPPLREESCSETAPEAFTSFTRSYPFERSSADGRNLTGCSYAWRYVPAAAARLREAGTRIAAVNVARGAGALAVPAAVAHLVGAPWPGPCNASGDCAVAAHYGGVLGRWVYAAPEAEDARASSEGSTDNITDWTPVLGVGETEGVNVSSSSEKIRSMFEYDPGPRVACEARLNVDPSSRRRAAVVSLPLSAHLASLHEWSDVAVAAAVAPLMCHASTNVCASTTSEEGMRTDGENGDGAGAVAAQCGAQATGAGVNGTAACLDALAFAVCGRVTVSDANVSAQGTTDNEVGELGSEGPHEECFNDGELIIAEAAGDDDDGVFAVYACDRVCRHRNQTTTEVGTVAVAERRLGRAELEVTCEVGSSCELGEMKRWAPGEEANDRRDQVTRQVDRSIPAEGPIASLGAA